MKRDVNDESTQSSSPTQSRVSAKLENENGSCECQFRVLLYIISVRKHIEGEESVICPHLEFRTLRFTSNMKYTVKYTNRYF